MDLSATALPVSLLKPLAAPTAAQGVAQTAGLSDATKRARIDKTAHDYEGAFISIMLGQMFEGVSTTTFGGGAGEDAFKSFLTDAMAKQMAKHGGVGLSGRLSSEMLKMQGLAPLPSATATPAGAWAAAKSPLTAYILPAAQPTKTAGAAA